MESRELAIYALLVGAFTALTVITPAFISGYMTIDLLIIAQSIVLTTLAVTGIEALGVGCIAGVIEFIISKFPTTAQANIPCNIASAVTMWFFISARLNR